MGFGTSKKNDLFANFKKCHFYQNEVKLLGYIVSAQRIQIEDKKIEVIKNWPESKLINDIKVFIEFANFYQQFI